MYKGGGGGCPQIPPKILGNKIVCKGGGGVPPTDIGGRVKSYVGTFQKGPSLTGIPSMVS